ncbi:hypothetical protein ACQ4PT_004867 [Festuca glaucescens]
MDDKRVIRRSKRLERSSPDEAAAPPPERRTRRTNGPLRPRERQASVPVKKAARSPSPPYGERDSEDTTAAPPPARRDGVKAPAPPPKRDGSVRTAYVLRNRHVPDTSDREPYIPARHEKREELKHDRPCSSRKKLKREEPWEAPACARMGLEHYNSMNQGDEHELVKAVDVHSFVCCGMWLHANFLARRKGAKNCVDLVPKYFFAELNLDGFGLLCASCVKIDSVESKNLGGCGECPGKIRHPADGTYLGAQACREPAAGGGLEVAFSF